MPSTQRLLSSTAATLTHLDLDICLYSGLCARHWDYSPRAKPMFRQILGQTHFPTLTCVVLRGWLLPLDDLEDFLLAHAGTLRNIHLINCCLAGASKDDLMTSIRKKLEPALALSGIEIYALVYESQCLKRKELIEYQIKTHIQCLPGPEDSEETVKARTKRVQVRWDRSDLEKLFMGGRRNAVTRVERENSDMQSRTLWWRDSEGDDLEGEPEDLA